MMETVNKITPAAEQTPASVELVMKRCVNSDCTWTFQEGKGFVPALPMLYQRVRGGDVDHRYPLTKSEVLSQEVCPMRCASQLRRNGIQAHPTSATLRLMERFAKENVQSKEERALRQSQFEERQRRRNLAAAARSDDRGFVRETFVKTLGDEAKAEKPGKQKRHHQHLPKSERNPNAPKRFGDEGHRIAPVERSNTKKKNKKGKGDEAGGKRKKK